MTDKARPKLKKMPNANNKRRGATVKSYTVNDWNKFCDAAKKLRDARDAYLRQRRAVSSGATVEVDYFAIEDVLEYIEDYEHDMRVMVDVREVARKFSGLHR